MSDFDEDMIWDTIMESAKRVIDYNTFAAFFPFNPDNFLSSIIYGFAVGRSADVISGKISAQAFMTGNTVNESALLGFIKDSHSALSHQVALTTKALQMMNAGAEPVLVYETIKNAL